MPAPFITLIAAVAADGCIGRGGQLPFRIQADLKRFRSITAGKPVIMGRKTWDSLPRRPLPGRTNIVLSRSAADFPGAIAVRTLQDAITVATVGGSLDIMVIGGGEIYAQALPLAYCLQITRIDAPVPGGDAFFPEFESDPSWMLSHSEAAPHSEDEPPVVYQTYLRR